MLRDLTFENCRLTEIRQDDSQFINELFNDADVKKYFVLRDEHARNINAFVDYMVDAVRTSTVINYIIKDEFNESIGLITAELIRDNRNGSAIWNVAYAIDSEYRNEGYATEALKGFSDFLLRNFSIQEVSLDISLNNKASEAVAEKCGFSKPENRTGFNTAYFDMEHMEVGARFKWYKSLRGKRIMCFNKAADAYRRKDYISSLKFFKQAMQEEYQPGTPYTDAQIYANMAMAYSSVGMYEEDLNCLKKAMSMGLNNPSIQKELMWLRNNKGLF